MSAVLLGMFDDFLLAERARLALFREGFPTDRIDLVAAREPGRAAVMPADSADERFYKYFWTLLDGRNETAIQQLVERISAGHAAVTVHPRGRTETKRGTQILAEHGTDLIVEHALDDQHMERAAADHESPPWYRNFWIHSRSDTDCIYCRLSGNPIRGPGGISGQLAGGGRH